MRGDVPSTLWPGETTSSFSPRARGCSCRAGGLLFGVVVFPACAGMFLASWSARRFVGRFPRVRGDVPRCCHTPYQYKQFSPRARGCSSPHQSPHAPAHVFPACAGMFRKNPTKDCAWCRFPRVRGDVPPGPNTVLTPVKFSPRARGCSQRALRLGSFLEVFPACAGMFQSPLFPAQHAFSFPRVRGDVPLEKSTDKNAKAFSPRARGCSAWGLCKGE